MRTDRLRIERWGTRGPFSRSRCFRGWGSRCPFRGVADRGLAFRGAGLTLAVCLSAAIGCAPFPESPDPLDGSRSSVLAEVGDRQITAGELERRILARYYGPRALIGLVREALFLAEAERLGLTVEEAELDARVEEELSSVLGVTPGERQESLDRLRWQGLGLEDVRAELRAELGGMLLIQKVVTRHRDVGDEQLREIYDRTWSAPRRRVRHISFPLRGDPEDAEAVAMVETRANSVRRAILSGASFSESARALSGNPETASQGGEIGWLSREELGDPALAEFIFSLEVGSLSPLYREGEYGFHIFQVIEERPERPFDDVREELRVEALAAAPTDQEIVALEAQLRQRTLVRIRPGVLPPIGGE